MILCSSDCRGQLRIIGGGRGASRRRCRGGGRSRWGWRSGRKLQVFHFGGGYFHGSEAVAREVVNYDAEKVFAFGGSADLLTVLDAVGDVSLDLFEAGGD